MSKRHSAPLSAGPASPTGDSSRQIGVLIQHCDAAHTIAEACGEKFLAYMLAMTLQAARGIRHSDKTPQDHA